jgi:lipopolysaccharide biosynthesis glycosyltransferase
VCCQSIIERATGPVSFHPLALNMLEGFDGQRDGSNAFTISRFLVPSLCDFEGFALFLDGDMVVDIDLAELWAYRVALVDKAVGVVKHAYTPRHPRKYVGTPMENVNLDYPKKNWSSVMLWNCAHPKNRLLTRAYVAAAESKFLHRLGWLEDQEIGEISPGWNYLVGEQPPSNAHLYHYTLGVSGIKHYADWHASWKWHTALLRTLECAGEDPVEMVKRSQERIGAVRQLR